MGKTNLDLLNDCDSFPYPDTAEHTQLLTTSLYTLLSPPLPDRPQAPIGYLTESVFNALAKVPIRLKGEMETNRTLRTVTVFTQPTLEDRNAAVKATINYWREKKTFAVLAGWRNELYPCYGPGVNGQGYELLWTIERSASALFGIATYGIHLTAYTEIGEEKMKELGTKWNKLIWIPRRSKTKQTFPGMLDNTVAGGMAWGEDPTICVLRESEEEASLPESIVKANVKAVGPLTYVYVRDSRAGGENDLLQPECEYIYDLPLPADVIPKPNDSEVESFELLTIEKCQDYLTAGEFKPNCAIVMLDFWVRHGVITKETEGEDVYNEIVRRLHRDLGMPGPWR